MKRIIGTLAAIVISGSVFAATPSQASLEVISQTPDGKATLYKQAIADPGDAPDKAIFILDIHGAPLLSGGDNNKESLVAYENMGERYGFLLNKAHLPDEYQNLSLESFYNRLHDAVYKKEKHLDLLFKAITKESDVQGVDKKTGEIKYGRIPPREMALIRGAARTSGLTVDKLIYLDQMFLFTFLTHLDKNRTLMSQINSLGDATDVPQISQQAEPFGCSSLVTWGKYTVDGKMIFARNFDWTKFLHQQGLFANSTLISIFHPDNGDNSIALIGYPGWFFSDTGINDKGLFIEMNSGWYSSYTMRISTKTKAYADLLSDYLYQANTYDELYNFIDNSIPDISYVIIGTDGTDGQHLFAAEETADGFFNGAVVQHQVKMRKPYDPGSISHYTIDPKPGAEDVLVASNAFRLEGWVGLNSHSIWPAQVYPFPYPDQNWAKDDSSSYPMTRYYNLLQQARKVNAGKDKITVDAVKNIMERSLMKNADGGATGYEDAPSLTDAEAVTYFSLVATTDQKGKLFNWWLRMPAKENQCSKGSEKCNKGWVNIDLNQFFNN